MRKLLSIVLCIVIIFSFVSLAGCGSNTLKFGVGTYAYRENVSDSLDGEDGKAETVVNIAAVLLDSKGRVVECAIDCIDYSLGFSANGKYIPVDNVLSKYEQGDSYGMKANSGIKKEWYEQVDAFVELIKGKSITDIKALVAQDKKGNEDVINAGCTITVSEFVSAIERAVNNATDSKASKGNVLKIGTVSTQTGSKDATAEDDGANRVDTAFTVVALDKDKIVCAYSDALQSEVTFNSKGENTGKSGEITTKRDAGDSYGMSQHGQDLNKDGVVKEWYVQAEAFDNALKGKKSSEIVALVGNNGYPNESLQTAGCTIQISDMVKAAEKAAKVK